MFVDSQLVSHFFRKKRDMGIQAAVYQDTTIYNRQKWGCSLWLPYGFPVSQHWIVANGGLGGAQGIPGPENVGIQWNFHAHFLDLVTCGETESMVFILFEPSSPPRLATTDGWRSNGLMPRHKLNRNIHGYPRSSKYRSKCRQTSG